MRSKIFTRTVGYWPLQESSGQALDYSGNENHASTTNVTNYDVSGPVGSSSMEFDGSGDYISTKTISADDISVSVWINTGSTVASTSYGTPASGGWFFNWNGSNPNMRFSAGGSKITGSTSFTKNTWYHLVGVGTGKSTKLYIDGRLDAQATGESYSVETSNTVNIGRRSTNRSDNFDGKIAHVRVWDYPLPEASIKALYNASRGGFSASDKRTL